jgi:hypothetical protein
MELLDLTVHDLKCSLAYFKRIHVTRISNGLMQKYIYFLQPFILTQNARHNVPWEETDIAIHSVFVQSLQRRILSFGSF